MDDYKPSLRGPKPEEKKQEKKITKVVNGTVKTKKKTEMTKFKDVFIAEDASNVKSYILLDVLVPAVKKAVVDIVKDGIEMLIYGESGRSRKSGGAASYVSYSRYSDRRDDDRNSRDTIRGRSGYNYDDIIVQTRGEAEEILVAMDELIDTYGIVSVADLYELSGIACNYTDNKYGWTNLNSAEPVRVRDGYLLKLPRAKPLN